MRLPAGTYNVRYQQDQAIVRTRLQWILVGISLVVLFSFPAFASPKWLMIAISIAATVVALQGLNLLTGCCGQISVGHSAFVAVGAYASGILVMRLGLPFWMGIPFGGLTAGLIGLVFGLPSLRIKGFYLALATLAAQFIIIYLIYELRFLTRGTLGLQLPVPSIGFITLGSPKSYYFFAMAVAIIMSIVARNLMRSGIGRAFVAIRDNDIAAEVMGINLYTYKLLAFFIGCFFAGVGGALYAHFIGSIHPEMYTFMESVWFLGMLIVGGMGSTVGVVMGVVFFKVLGEFVSTGLTPAVSQAFPTLAGTVSAAAGLMAFGLVIVLFLVYEPRGLAHRWELLKSSYRLWPFSY